MALETLHLEVMRQHIKPGRVLCLGYPDLLVAESYLRKNVESAELKLVESPPQKWLQDWHGWDKPIYETDAVLRAMGYSVTYADIKPSRGVETVLDLNDRLPAPLRGEFDAVLDLGTLEHCLNVGQAFRNVGEALKPNGVVLHANPLQMTNHGWWSFSPEVYHGLYDKVDLHIFYWGNPAERHFTHAGQRATTRFAPEPESMQMAVCRGPRREWPMQRKYHAA